MACRPWRLTDHWLLTGAVEFVLACKQTGVRPILGLEIDIRQPDGVFPLVLLAAGEHGWSNLCALSSRLALREEPQAPCKPSDLDTYPDLIALSGDQGDPQGNRLLELLQYFPARLYVELQNTDGRQIVRMQRLAETAGHLRLPIVACQPVYMLTPQQARFQRLLTAIRITCPLEKLPPQAVAPTGSYWLDEQTMAYRFQDFPQALENTREVAERCRAEIPLGSPYLPAVPLPPGLTASGFLRQKAEAGAQRLYGTLTPEIIGRLDHELEVIAGRGFEALFLIVEELLTFARCKGIPFSSRGSAASSLVAHCLGITSPDPLALDLYFERFLNPARSTPPDIDTDLCSRRRDEVIEHVFDTYGSERVAMVATINRFRPRSALADAAKAHGLQPQKIRELSTLLPHSFAYQRDEESADTQTPPFAEIAAAYPQFSVVFQDAEALLKLPRHLSLHPGGLVLTPGPLTERIPLMRSGSKGLLVTQLDLEPVESLGLIKIDLLGIRGLTVLGDVAAAIHSWRRSEYKNVLQVLEDIPLVDPATSQRIENGRTIGCFQIESPGMRATLRDIHARTPQDIMAALALYRPGPLQGGLRDAFVRRFKGEEEVAHIHPALEGLLADTYGVILYQEQVLRIAHQLAGLSLGDADLLRRAMSHFDPGKQMQLLKERFIQGALQKSKVPPETGAVIWDMMAAFAGYGFPKAHAASYAQVSWRSAWLKTYFPAEFMAAVLANWGGYYSQRVYLSEARRMGLIIRSPHINFSRRNFCVTYRADSSGSADISTLYMGLDQVHELSRRTQDNIIRQRPFRDLDDFLTRVDPRRQEAESLVKVGALEGLGLIPDLLARLRTGGEWHAGQMSLFQEITPVATDWTLVEKVAAQEQILGIGVDAHPLELARSIILSSGAISTLEAITRFGQRVTVAGVRQTSRRSRTTKGEWMLFLTLEDLEGTLDVVFFPDAYRRARTQLQQGSIFLVTGMLEKDPELGDLWLKAEKLAVIR